MAVEVDKSLVNFPFLVDDNTVKHVEKSKVMFLMRGLPGSGKSTIVRLIAEKYKTNVTVCSADDYFLQEDGTYLYNKDKLSEAHDQCQQKAKEACEAGVHAIIIDNTNVRRWELSHYTNLASKHSYVSILVSPKTPWRFDAEELAKRNKHGVDKDKIQRKIKTYDRMVPLYYGWFLNDTGSKCLVDKVHNYFKQCLKMFPDFNSAIRENAEDRDAGEIPFNSYFSREFSSSETLHCTAFFSNRGRNKKVQCNTYASQDAVKRSLGKCLTLSIVGFVITSRTVGARIALTPRQARLWGKDDHEGIKGKSDGFQIVTDSPKYRKRGQRNPDMKTVHASSSQKASPNKSKPKGKQGKATLSNPFAALAASDSENTSANDSDAGVNEEKKHTYSSDSDDIDDAEDGNGSHSDSDPANQSPDEEDYEEMLAFEMGYVQLQERPRFMPTCGLGSRAHITIGYSKGTNAVQTGLDQIKIIAMEDGYHNSKLGNRPRHVELDDAAVIHYGDGQCVVYLNDPISVDSLFSARY